MSKKLGVGLLIGLGLLIVLFFSFRLARAFRQWGGPPRPQPQATITDVELIREWMTIPYIAHTYNVPDRLLFKALDIPENENRKKSLDEINDQFYQGQDGFVISQIKGAILAFQQQTPLPPEPDSPSSTVPTNPAP